MTTQSFVNEIKNFYNTSQARSELEDMLQSNRLYKKSDVVIDFIRTLQIEMKTVLQLEKQASFYQI